MPQKKGHFNFLELKYKCRHTFFYFCGNEEGINVTTCSLKRKYLQGKRNSSWEGVSWWWLFQIPQRLVTHFTARVLSEIKVILAERNCLHFQIPQRIFISLWDMKASMGDKAKVSGPYWWFQKKYIWLFEVRTPQKILAKKSFHWAWPTNNFDNTGSTHQSNSKSNGSESKVFL